MQEPIRLGNGCLKFLVFIVSVIYLKSNWSDIYGNSNNDNEIHLVVGRDLYILLASSIGNDFRKKTSCHLQHCWWHFEDTGDPTGKSVTNISSLSLTYMYFVPQIIANINEVHGIGPILSVQLTSESFPSWHINGAFLKIYKKQGVILWIVVNCVFYSNVEISIIHCLRLTSFSFSSLNRPPRATTYSPLMDVSVVPRKPDCDFLMKGFWINM